MNWGKTIFLAHASEDKPYVRSLYRTLKSVGLDPWLDEKNIDPGSRWDEKIRDAIKHSRFFLGCISRNSITKDGYIQKELRLALTRLELKPPGTTYFIPALLDDVALPDLSVGNIRLMDYQAAILFNQEGLNKLISHLNMAIDNTTEQDELLLPIRNTVKAAVENGDTEAAITKLLAHAQRYELEAMDSGLMLASRFHSLKRNDGLGILTREQYLTESNRITSSLLDLVETLDAKVQ